MEFYCIYMDIKLRFIMSKNSAKQHVNIIVESRQSLLPTGVLYSRLQRATIPDAVIIQFDLLKMSIVLLETFRKL